MNQNSILLNQVTPEQLVNAFTKVVDAKFDELKKGFEPKTPTDLLTRQETADLLKINLSTLYHWVRAKKIPAYGISGRVYFKRHEVEQLLTPINK